MPHIRTFLDLSTAHLRPKDKEALECYAAPESMTGPSTAKHMYGWWMYATDDYDPALTDVLENISKYARAHGCEYVLFDADAPEDEALPMFDEDGDPPLEDQFSQFVGDRGTTIEQAG
jgi:hypothetical protein